MKIAYIRVSSIDQNEQRQIEEMEKFGAEKIFIENFIEYLYQFYI